MKPRKEKLEQELKSLTETKQKLKKEIHHLKANMRNNNSIMVDLSNQTHSCDGSFIPIQSLNYKLPPINCGVGINESIQCGYFQKEVKTSLNGVDQHTNTFLLSTEESIKSTDVTLHQSICHFHSDFAVFVSVMKKCCAFTRTASILQ